MRENRANEFSKFVDPVPKNLFLSSNWNTAWLNGKPQCFTEQKPRKRTSSAKTDDVYDSLKNRQNRIRFPLHERASNSSGQCAKTSIVHSKRVWMFRVFFFFRPIRVKNWTKLKNEKKTASNEYCSAVSVRLSKKRRRRKQKNWRLTVTVKHRVLRRARELEKRNGRRIA